jgi:hypothetical protein
MSSVQSYTGPLWQAAHPRLPITSRMLKNGGATGMIPVRPDRARSECARSLRAGRITQPPLRETESEWPRLGRCESWRTESRGGGKYGLFEHPAGARARHIGLADRRFQMNHDSCFLEPTSLCPIAPRNLAQPWQQRFRCLNAPWNAAGKLLWHARVSMFHTCGVTENTLAGCSIRPSSKATADESTGGVASGLR